MSTSPSLDTLFQIGQQALHDGKEINSIMAQIFKCHGGLCQSYQRNYGKQLEPFEIMGYAWEALPQAIIEWDKSKGKASTCWGLIIRRITTAQRENNMYKGGVKVGLKVAKRYTGMSYDDTMVGAVDYDYKLLREDEDGTILFGDDTRSYQRNED